MTFRPGTLLRPGSLNKKYKEGQCSVEEEEVQRRGKNEEEIESKSRNRKRKEWEGKRKERGEGDYTMGPRSYQLGKEPQMRKGLDEVGL